MSLFEKKNDMEPMCSMNNTREKHTPKVLFRTSYGVISIIDPDSIKRFQAKCGLIIDGKIGPMTRAAIKMSLIDPSDIGALDKAIPIRVKRGSGISSKEAEDMVKQLIRQSGSF